MWKFAPNEHWVTPTCSGWGRFRCSFRADFWKVAPIIFRRQNDSKGGSRVIGASDKNWREKREFARLEQPVTGVTEHAGVARSLDKRKFGANLDIFYFGYLSLLDILGSSGCKFGANLDIWRKSELVLEHEKSSQHGDICKIWEFCACKFESICR